jgi:hypothetical protein
VDAAGGDVDELADMEEIEIDPNTPEGQALLEQLMAAGAVEVDESGEAVTPGQRPGRTLIRGDLGVPGAVGPETHVYSGMAVHLYMRKR